jgi:hypothetical protein
MGPNTWDASSPAGPPRNIAWPGLTLRGDAMRMRPIVPEDVKHARPAVYLTRAATASLRSFITGETPTKKLAPAGMEMGA